MRKIVLFFLSALLFIPVFAKACTAPVAQYTDKIACTDQSALDYFSTMKKSDLMGGVTNTAYIDNYISFCQLQIAQYQADTLTYQNCLNSVPTISTMPVAQASAVAGTIKILNFPSELDGVIGIKTTEIYINFLYSGTNQNRLGVSIVGGKLPGGMKLDNITYSGNGLFSIGLYGTPTQVGNFPLNIVVTDNSGAMATQPLDYKVSGLTFIGDSSLPDATPYKQYSQKIIYSYIGDTSNVRVTFTISPVNNPQSQITVNSGGSDGTAELSFNPEDVGQFTVKAEARVQIDSAGDVSDIAGTKTFNLNVVAAKPVVNQVVNQPTTSVATPPVVAPVVTPQPVKQAINPPPVKKVNTEKPAQPTNTIQSTPEQNPVAGNNQTSIKVAPQTKPVTSDNIFTRVWSFVKNIFKFGK